MLSVLFAFSTVGIVCAANNTPHQFTQLGLKSTSTTQDVTAAPAGSLWVNMPGNQVSVFKLQLNPAKMWYFIDIKSVKPVPPAGTYGFSLDMTTLPVDLTTWNNYWLGKGSGVVPLIYSISHGTAPIFFIVSDGTSCKLVDGYFYQQYGLQTNLRVDGSYLAGTYNYKGTIGTTLYSMQITFFN
jgi:hypothetical protein